MEVAGVVFSQAPCFSSSAVDASNLRHFHSFPMKKQSRCFCPAQQANRKSVEFSDKSYLQYYNGPRMEIKEKEIASKKKEMKKKLKLLKGLSKNLSTFSEMGFGLNPGDGLDYQVKGQMISEATEVLLGQLQRLKAEKLESRMKKKEEKAKKKAARMGCEESKSSSSSSSESDCEMVVSTSQLKTIAAPPKEEASSSPSPSPSSSLSSCLEGVGVVEENRGKIGWVASIDGVDTKKTNKIEVCMGGKCKKSGAALLLENFEKALVGEGEAEAVVVGCKCMGKCRDGPNVRVVRDDLAVANPLSLCVGVGLEDVDLIVNSFIGGIRSQPAPALSGV